MRSVFRALVILLSLASLAEATVHRVEQDGTGDHEILQDGLNAAAPGDTVLVGPGVYGEYQTSGVFAVGRLSTPDVVVQGAGPDATIIAPGGISGSLATGLVVEASGVVICALGLEYFMRLVVDRAGAKLTRVRFANPNGEGYVAEGAQSAVLRDCSFVGAPTGARIDGQSTVRMEGCSLEAGVRPSVAHVEVLGGSALDLADCEIGTGTTYGVRVANATLQAAGTHFGIGTESALRLVDAATANLEDCTLGAGAPFTAFASEAWLEATGTRFGAGTTATIRLVDASTTIGQSELLNGGGATVWVDLPRGSGTLDMRDNWWGSASESVVRGWIDDIGAGEPDLWERVEFLPIRGSAVATRQSSFGGLKARYGGFRGEGR